jgi:hypothetical protein
MASVYDHWNRNMLELFKAFIQTESYEAAAQVIATWKQLARLGYKGRDEEESVAPHEVSWKVGMMDSAQGPVSAVEEAFAHLRAEKGNGHGVQIPPPPVPKEARGTVPEGRVARGAQEEGRAVD